MPTFPSVSFRYLWCFVLLLGCSGSDESSTPQTAACEPGFVTEVVSVSYGDLAGFGQDRMPDVVLGPPEGGGEAKGGLDVVSLGIGGEIVLGFGFGGISDGPGDDFVVFENAFWASGDPTKPFVEPGELSVSEDGSTWTVMPCSSEATPPVGCAGVTPVLASSESGISAFDLEGAGGDAFDLAEVGAGRARYLRIRGRSSSVTPNGTAGFDLDAVAVLHPECP